MDIVHSVPNALDPKRMFGKVPGVNVNGAVDASTSQHATSRYFLDDGGKLGSLIGERDWSTTSLGPINLWPQSLRSMVGFLLRSAVPIVMLWGEDGVMLYNDAYSVFAGGRHPQLLGSKVREGWPEVADFNDNVMRVGLAGGTLAYRDQELTLHRHGRPEQVWMNLDYSPVIDEAGRPAGVIAIVIETTERIIAERRLAAEAFAERKLLADLVDNTDAFVQVADFNYRFLAINRASAQEFERIFGVRPKVGDSMLDLLAHLPEHQAAVKATWSRALAGEEFTTIEEFGDSARVRRAYEIKFNILRDVQGERIGAYQFVTDVTERLSYQSRLIEAEDALRQSQKMEAIGQLTGGLAHDFNNLLTGISGSLDLLQKRVAQGRINDLDRYLIAAQSASKRAAALTHRLLAFSRRQTLDPKPTDVHKLVLGMADLIRRTVGPEITVETVDMVGLWPALVDPPQLENALLNLCINARDAMPDGGRITIETANRWMDERTARERDVEPGQYLSLCVSDTGTGMPPDVIARAFDPFFTTKPLGQGTGLGLSMIYGFVRQSGGQVRIYSEVGQGTMVCIYLPRFYGAAEAPEVKVDRGDMQRAGAGETVLVVDDEPSVRMLVLDVLEDLGYASLEAEDGPSGLRMLQGQARLDLLITDVGLPGGMNGRQVADAARVLRPGLKVLFITGYAENAVVGNGHLDPGMAILTKPFAIDDIAAKIRSLIEE